jgi:hypothetical protein
MDMTTNIDDENVFTREVLDALFPPERTEAFFEALFGGAEEGAYDIRLVFRGKAEPDTLRFAFELRQRPGKCLACNLTYGLPRVFERHPIINAGGIAEGAGRIAGWEDTPSFRLERTEEISPELHLIPLTVRRR